VPQTVRQAWERLLAVPRQESAARIPTDDSQGKKGSAAMKGPKEISKKIVLRASPAEMSCYEQVLSPAQERN